MPEYQIIELIPRQPKFWHDIFFISQLLKEDIEIFVSYIAYLYVLGFRNKQ